MATQITNISTGALMLPPPYLVAVPAGGSVIVADSLATVQGYLGTTTGLWRTTTDPFDTVSNPAPPITAAALAAGAVGAAALAAGAVGSAAVNPGLVQQVAITLTNAQIKALNTTPITLVAAQGVGKAITPIDCSAYLSYGGTSAFTASVGENLRVKHSGGAAIWNGGSQAFLQLTNSAVSDFNFVAAAQASITENKSGVDNTALVIDSAAAIAGNAANDNTITIVV